MAKLYNGGYTYPNGISVAAGKPLDDRLVLNSVEDLYINSSTRNAGTAVLYKIAYTGMPVIIANNGNPYVVLLKNSAPYENGATAEVNASNYTTYWTISGKSVEDYISGTIDPSINKLETRLGKADSSIGILNSSVSELESHTKKTDSSVSTLNSSVNKLETRVGKVDISIGTLNSSVNVLENHISKTDTSINTINSSVNKLETHAGRVDISIGTINSSVSGLETHISKTDASVSTLNSSVNKLETRLAKADSSIVILNSSVSSLETHISKTDTSIGTLNSSVSNIETHISKTDSSISTLNSSVNVLENHTSKTDTLINTINSSVNVLETRVGKADISIGTLNSSVNVIETHISNTDVSIYTLDSSLNELNTSLEQLYVDFESFGNDVTSSIHALNSSYNNLVEEIIANEEVVAAAITELNEKIDKNMNSGDLEVSDSISTYGADFAIADSDSNVLAKFSNGGIVTKEFNSEDINTSIAILDSSVSYIYDNLFGISSVDEEVLSDILDRIDVLEENSSTYVTSIDNFSVNNNSDLDFADSSGNVIMRLQNGQIQTKDFDSSYASKVLNVKDIFNSEDNGTIDTISYSDLHNSKLITVLEDGSYVSVNLGSVRNVEHEENMIHNILYYDYFDVNNDSTPFGRSWVHIKVNTLDSSVINIVNKSI